jgi:asparagine synthase (glutamine-hydrolysing)
MDVVQLIPKLYSEPFSASSQIPTFLVSQLAKKQVTVSLSGDAGDELFCGYNRYTMASMHWEKIAMLPVFLRKIVASGLLAISPKTWNRLLAPANSVLPRNMQMVDFGGKLHKSAAVLASHSLSELYFGLVSHWTDPTSLVIRGNEPLSLPAHKSLAHLNLDPVQEMMFLDTLTYLPDDILTKVDRAAMGVSLESRVPFLDHRVVEFAWRLPQELKLREGQGKWILREVLHRYVPRELIERPKMGFAVPIDSWLRGPMREWAEALLNESRLRQEGFFNPEPIRKKWAQHLSGSHNWQHHLWDVLMFQTWLEETRV